MKIQFERWSENNSVKGETIELFNEGILCYKVGAYRAAFIMTYLGFQSELKNRIIFAENKPDGIKDNYWENIKSEVQDDSGWEKEVSRVVEMSKPDNIFLIGEDIKKQYSYWRSIRNDCAHAKDNIISYPHVEGFWLFIQSNYNKFVINGGKEGLMDRLKRHYDVRYTPSNTDISYIIDSITSSIKISEIEGFINEVYSFFEEDLNIRNQFSDRHGSYSFWNGMLHSEDYRLRDSVINFVKRDVDLFISFIVVYPQYLDVFLEDKDLCRLIWTMWIRRIILFNRGIGWECVKRLVDRGLIPEGENDILLKNLFKQSIILPPDELIPNLLKIGYFDKLKARIFDKSYYQPPYGINNLNCEWDLIKYYITKVDMDEEIVRLLNSSYISSSYGKFYDGMTYLFQNNEKFREKYISILSEYNIKVPEQLNDLIGD